MPLISPRLVTVQTATSSGVISTRFLYESSGMIAKEPMSDRADAYE